MKILLTGANGTIGSELKKFCTTLDIEVVTWDRNSVPIDNYHRMEDFVCKIQPAMLFHLAAVNLNTYTTDNSWLANYEWTSELAWITQILNIPFIYTSTAMVFSCNVQGPFTIHSQPDTKEGYGYEKRRAEERIFYQNPKATVVRLGWQIGEKPGSNNMVDYFDRHMRQYGHIEASTRWKPACSFIEDTVKVLFALAKFPPGLYMLDSNEKWSFFEIACALNELHGGKWTIIPDHNFIYDQRLLDDRIKMPSLNNRLKGLM